MDEKRHWERATAYMEAELNEAVKRLRSALKKAMEEMPEPHTCPTCDGYGWLREPTWSSYPMKVEDVCCSRGAHSHAAGEDIPCPDCNA